MSKIMSLKPRLSEKTYALSELTNTYVFEVPEDANKQTVAAAVAIQYSVTVTQVRIMNIPGKTKRTYHKQTRAYVSGKRADIKKAYVTLKEGDKLPIFASVEDSKETK